MIGGRNREDIEDVYQGEVEGSDGMGTRNHCGRQVVVWICAVSSKDCERLSLLFLAQARMISPIDLPGPFSLLGIVFYCSLMPSQFKDVPSRVDVDKLEREVLDYWEREHIFEKSLEKTKNGSLYTFYDGPPYATGKPHYGHILQSAIKDTVLRYKTMRGYHVPRQVGWDCHGLPVETIVEKELGFKTKKDIEEYGIEQFNEKCRETVTRYVDVFTDTLKRIGRWADYGKAYFTMERDYMESEWWVFKQLWERELVYKAFRSSPYCIRCATPLSNFEVSMAYKDTTDTAVYVMLPVVGEGGPPNRPTNTAGRRADQQLSLLIWTTTPWTLPGNAAVAVSPDLHYVSVEHEGKELIVAKERLEEVFGGEVEVGREWTTSELTELRYEPLYETKGAETSKDIYRVVTSEHVSAEEGTGLVHIAPAFGEEDAKIGQQQDLPLLRTVDVGGRFTDDVPLWSGKPIFAANAEIVDDLRERGLLFRDEQYTHSYPFCWRCETPLIYYAIDSWFVRVSDLKERMLKINEQINWTPGHVKKGRFAKGIESAPDWAVSRNRFWSVPIPVWQCDKCDEQVCVGSVAELAKLAQVNDVPDIHRPYVDELTWDCQQCSGTMRRIPEVLDAWFDSGSMPYSRWHYPFENKEFMEAGFPADFIAESIEQTRAWFYTLHVLTAALTTKNIGLGKDKPAYKNVIASGLIFAEDGQKLSKKLKNYPEPEPTIAMYGADVLRLYLLSSTSLGEPYRFSEKELKQLQRNTYLTLWNVYSFFTRYARVRGWEPDLTPSPSPSKGEGSVLDSWILARTTQLEREVVAATDDYQIDQAARLFIPFVDDLSNWYVRRSRTRFQRGEESHESDAAFATLYDVLVRVAKLMAPFMPFVAEEIYRNLVGGESVHLEQIDEPGSLSADDRKLISEMAAAREIVTEGLALRASKQIKVRQPLARLVVVGKSLSEELIGIVKDEVNVKSLEYAPELPKGESIAASDKESRVQVALDIEITPELKSEGLAREIIRHGQVLRREAGYALDDRIAVVFKADDTNLAAVLDEHRQMIAYALQADEIVEQADNEDASADLVISETKVHLAVVKQ